MELNDEKFETGSVIPSNLIGKQIALSDDWNIYLKQKQGFECIKETENIKKYFCKMIYIQTIQDIS